MVVDAREGLTPIDQEVAKRLQYVETPVICVANKADDATIDANADEFYKLGRGKLLCTSTTQNRNRQELFDLIAERLPPALPENATPPPESEMKVAIVGRRNVGKSTFVNTLAQAERMIVSEVPGTTRDSVDVRFELDGKAFMAIDTPGLKRGRSIASDVEFYSLHRAQRSIRRADVVLLFFDPTQRISKVDKQLCDYIAQQYKPCVFVVNKWDLQHDSMPTEKWVHYLHDTFRAMHHVPIAFITGKTGKNVKALLNHAQMLFNQARQRVATSDLNKLLRGGDRSQSAADLSEPAAENLFRDTGRRRAANVGVVLLESRRNLANLPPLSAGRIPRSAAVYRSADQAVPAPPRRSQQTGVGKCQRIGVGQYAESVESTARTARSSQNQRFLAEKPAKFIARCRRWFAMIRGGRCGRDASTQGPKGTAIFRHGGRSAGMTNRK